MECPDTDQELVEKWRRDGDVTHAHVLVQRHYPRMLNLFYRLTGTSSQAEELTQDVYVKIWQQLHNYRGEAQFTTWITRIAINTVISYQRKHGPAA